MWWYSSDGKQLEPGSIVWDTERKIIGKIIIWDDCKPYIFIKEEKNPETGRYQQVDNKGPNEMYLRPLYPKKSKPYWILHHYCIPNIILLEGEKNETQY